MDVRSGCLVPSLVNTKNFGVLADFKSGTLLASQEDSKNFGIFLDIRSGSVLTSQVDGVLVNVKSGILLAS